MKKFISAFLMAILSSTIAQAVEYGSLTDSRDQKTYRTIKIGTQTWMADNIAHNIDNCLANSKAADKAQSKKCWYPKGDANNEKSFGLLYDFNTAQTLCPEGWRLPNKGDLDLFYKTVCGNQENEAQAMACYKKLLAKGFAPMLAGNFSDDYYDFNWSMTIQSVTPYNEKMNFTLRITKEEGSQVDISPKNVATSIRCIKN